MKFKNIKKPLKRNKNSFVKKSEPKKTKDKQQFPNIYRIIPEKIAFLKLFKVRFRLPWQAKRTKLVTIFSIVFTFLIVLVLLSGIMFFSINIFSNWQLYQKISKKQDAMRSQINFWQSIVDKYDGYKDAYFKIAILEYQLGDYQKAKINNQKALLLDPNFDQAKKLEVILNK